MYISDQYIVRRLSLCGALCPLWPWGATSRSFCLRVNGEMPYCTNLLASQACPAIPMRWVQWVLKLFPQALLPSVKLLPTPRCPWTIPPWCITESAVFGKVWAGMSVTPPEVLFLWGYGQWACLQNPFLRLFLSTTLSKIMSKLAASGETSRKINYWGCDKLFVSYFVKHCWFCHISMQFSLGKYGHGKLHGRQEC